MNLDARIGRFWTLRELCRTNHRSLDNAPTPEVAERLELLALTILDPLREVFGPTWCESGYRSPEVNAAAGGAMLSAHIYGCAADLVQTVPWVTVDRMMAWLAASDLPYDQAIAEHSHTGEWLHVGITRPGYRGPRRELLHKPYGEPFELWTRPPGLIGGP